MLSRFFKMIIVFSAGVFMLVCVGFMTTSTILAASEQTEGFIGMLNISEAEDLLVLIPVLAILVLPVGIALVYKIILILGDLGAHKGITDESLIEVVKAAGYAYDKRQDIFYSVMDAWQRNFGYCRLYDEASAPFGMIIDCEPIYFEYGGEEWLIEFWKGQYDLTTGCEIGVYKKAVDLSIPGFFSGIFYNCVSNEELLKMSYSLQKNGKRLLNRKERHWWLTGFKLGEFSEPSELTMYITISFDNPIMRDAFIDGLYKAGYTKERIRKLGNRVSLTFDKPLTEQPFTRIPATDWVIQRKNEQLCAMYQNVTKGCSDIVEKFKAIEEKQPKLYDKIVNVGRARQVYDGFDTLKKYL